MRVVVIGAGVIGLCSAWELHKSGFQVVVVEEQPSLGESPSFGNGGLVAPSHVIPLASPGLVGVGLKLMWDKSSPFGFSDLPGLAWWTTLFLRSAKAEHVDRCAPLLRDLCLESRDAFREMAEEVPGITLEERGLIMLSQTHETHKAETALVDRCRALGLAAEVLSQADLQKKNPQARMKAAGAVWFADDCHVSPPVFMRGLRAKLEAEGVDFLFGKGVKKLVLDGGRVTGLELEDGCVDGDLFVLAAGAWSGLLAETVGLSLPMAAGRGWGFTVPHPPEPLDSPLILVEARIAVTPMTDGMRFVGAMELGRPGPPPKKESPRVGGMKKRIPQYLPAYEGFPFPESSWSGLRPCSPDGMPYIGRTGAAGGLIVAAGHAMIGMTLGPVTGRMVARAAKGEPMGYPTEPLSPDRFA